MRRALLTVLLAGIVGVAWCGASCARASEILWDEWGVPHIYAESEADLMYAWGWAQMQSHGNLLLEQFGIVRGRAAEYWGEAFLASDTYVWTMGLPRLVRELGPAMEGDASFVDGMNAYVRAHPAEFEPRLVRVLPITNQDTLALALYDEFFNGMVVTPASMDELRRRYLAGASVRDVRPGTGVVGSNAWAIAPGRSTSGNAILLANPHAPWPSLAEARHLLFCEAHVVLPDLAFYGAGLVGLPAFVLGFNDRLGWAGTSAPAFDFVDAYELTLRDGGYLFDGRVRPFDVEEVALRVRTDDGGYRVETVTARRSVHGPVIAEKDGKAVAVAFPLPGAEEARHPQLWDMMRAKDVDAFLAALEPQNLFAFNFLYADRAGNIVYVLNGIFPDRPAGGYDWGAMLPGDTSATLWRGKLPFRVMPVVSNPESGHLQSANEPPHFVAWPDAVPLADAPGDWPEPDAWPRTQRSLALLTGREAFSVDDVARLKFDTRSGLADRVLDTVVALGRQHGSPEAKEAAEVLAAWDRSFEPDSVGAVVFAFWAMHFEPSILAGTRFPAAAFAVAFDPADPVGTPSRLARPAKAVEGLEFAARAVKQAFGSLHVPWGAFVRFRVGDRDFPAFGAPPEAFGVFSPNFAAPTSDGTLATVAGDTWVAVIEFGDPPTARAVLPYGNATQAGSAHVGDQLGLYAQKRLRPVWTERSEIEAHLERRETLER